MFYKKAVLENFAKSTEKHLFRCISFNNSDMDNILTELDEHNSDMDNIQTELDEHNSDLDNMQTELDEYNSDMDNLRNVSLILATHKLNSWAIWTTYKTNLTNKFLTAKVIRISFQTRYSSKLLRLYYNSVILKQVMSLSHWRF